MTQKKINNYIIFLKQVLGKGSFGSVYKGEQDNSKLSVAVKVLDKDTIDHDQYLKSALFSEVQILQLLKSENVIKVLDVMESSHNYYIIQQLCDSDLDRYILSNPQITQEQSIHFLKQICNGFIALVKEGIVHRDLKPANILLCKEVIKIGDFGFAKRNITKRMKNATSVGTPLYMSPQVLKSQPYTSKCDVWATGFIFYQMLHGRTPWTARSQFELVKNIETKPLIINQNLKEETKDFLRRSLEIQEEGRISWDQVFVHPIFNGYFHQYAQQNEMFENKLKMVMSQLRFQINSKNIDMRRLLQNLGFTGVKELNFYQFDKFIRHVHSDITKQQIKFFFQKMDSNADGSVSLIQLQNEMQKHFISFTKINSQIVEESHSLKVKKISSMDNIQYKPISVQLEQKVKKCFIKLYKIITAKKISLRRTFQAYDYGKVGSLTYNQFEKILMRLDQSFTYDQMSAAFEYIDTDKSKTIEFQQLRTYYCKVNCIPESLQTEGSHSKSTENSSNGSHHNQHSSHRLHQNSSHHHQTSTHRSHQYRENYVQKKQ